MNSFKQKCIELRKQDFTLPEIVKITERPKTSVYFHIQNLPLSEEKQQQIREASAERIKKFPSARKGKSEKIFRKFTDWDKDMVCLVSHLLFDGEIQRTGCSYSNRNLALISRIESAMRIIYDFEPRRYYNPTTGVSRISYYNVELGAYFKQRAEELLLKINSLPRDFKIVFLRAFFDDEGCVDFRPEENRRRIRGYQHSYNVLLQIQKLLMELGVKSKIDKKYQEVIIGGRENIKQFAKEINFSLGVCINGKRSNSIWKQDLEKREILRRALVSYKT